MASAVVVPSWLPPSNTVTLLLASAVPVSVTWFVLTILLELITGAPGATVSMVTFWALDAALVTPDTVSVAVKLWLPFTRLAVASLHAPLALAVTLPRSLPLSKILTVLFATALPLSVSVLSLVIWSPATPLSVVKVAMLGVATDGAEIVAVETDEAPPTLPAASDAVAVIAFEPVESAPVGELHAP